MSDIIRKYKAWFEIIGNENSKTEFEFEIHDDSAGFHEECEKAKSKIMNLIDFDFDLIETIDNTIYKGIFGGEYKTKEEAFDAEIKILLEKKLPEVSELCDFYDKYRVLWRSSKHFEDFKLNKKY